jgi:hypothetical protein
MNAMDIDDSGNLKFLDDRFIPTIIKTTKIKATNFGYWVRLYNSVEMDVFISIVQRN